MGLGDGLDAGAAGLGGGGGAGGGSINFSGGTTSQNLSAITFDNAGGVSFGLDAVLGVMTAVAPGGAPSPVNFSAGTTSNNLGSVVFSNSNGISFGLSGSTITGTVATNYQSQGAYLTTAMRSDAVTLSNVNLSAGTTSTNASAFTFSNSNGISFGLSSGAGAGVITASYTVPTVTNSSMTVSDAATSGTLARLAFTNLNGITLSLSTGAGGSHTIVGSYTVPTQTNQSAINGLGASNTGNTAGNTGLSTGIDWVIAGSNNITISESTAVGGPNTLWVSGPTVGGAQTGISGIGGSNTTYTSGTVIFSNLTNVTISSSVNGASQYLQFSGNAAQTVQSAIEGVGVSNTGNTAGNTGLATGKDLVFAASGAITASQSTGAAVNTIWYSVAAQSSQSAAEGVGVSNTGNTLGNTGVATGKDIAFAASGAITASQSTGAAVNTVWFSVAAQSNQSAIKGLGASNTGNTAGNTGLSTGIDWVIAGSNMVTISESTAVGGPNTLWVNATQTNQSAINGLGASNTGNTAGNTGISTGIDWVMAGTGAVTVSESTTAGGPNTLWFSAPNAAAGNVTFSAGANSSGLGSVIFSNSNNVSFGLGAGSVITASIVTEGIGITNSGNTAGTSGTVTAGNYLLVGSGAITLSQSSSGSNATLTLTVPNSSQLTGVSPISVSSAGSTISVQLITVPEWAPDNNGNLATNSTIGQSSLFFYPIDIPYPISGSRLNVFMSVATRVSATASSGSGSVGVGYALYTRGTGASTERISQLTSYSAVVISYTASSDSQFGATYYAGLSNATSHTTATTALSTSNASTFPATSLGGFRVVALPLNLTLTPGRYWIGLSQQSTNNAAGSYSIAASYLQSTMSNFIAYRALGANSAASNASVWGVSAGLGTYSAQSAAWPNSIGLSNSDIKMPPSMTFPYFNISGIGTSTNIL